MHRIQDVARLVEVSPSTLRLWEQHGLVSPLRNDGGQRLYSDEHVEVIRSIKRLREVEGLNLAAIRRLLSEQSSPDKRRGVKTPAVVEPEGPKLGDRFRIERRKAGLSLRDAAASTGLPISFISTFERTSKGATVSSLQALANCYGTTVTQLSRPTAPAGSHRGKSIHPVVRRGAERALPTLGAGIKTFQLAESLALLDCQKWVLQPGAESEGAYSHEGEEFIHVLAGQFVITLDGSEQHRLSAGDSIAFSSARPHAWHATGSEPTVLFWVNTPRSF